MSDQDRIQNFSLQCQYNIKQTKDGNKEKYQLGDYKLTKFSKPPLQELYEKQ